MRRPIGWPHLDLHQLCRVALGERGRRGDGIAHVDGLAAAGRLWNAKRKKAKTVVPEIGKTPYQQWDRFLALKTGPFWDSLPEMKQARVRCGPDSGPVFTESEIRKWGPRDPGLLPRGV